MKKIFTFVMFVFIFSSFNTTAQTSTACNAKFSFLITNNIVQFTSPANADSQLVYHSWNFGDGTTIQNVFAPLHTYTSGGSYTVTQYVVRRSPNNVIVCSDSVKQTVTIANLSCTVVPAYTWKIDSLNPTTVHFTNATLPVSTTDSVKWFFGDGNTFASTWNATHVYPQPGKYYACLRIQTNANCVKYQCDTITIPAPVVVCNLQAYFNYTADSLQFNKINFHNYTTNLTTTDSIYWSFGDSTTSRDINPVHIYANAGTYHACVYIKRNKTPGTAPCLSDFCRTVTVIAPCNLTVSYSYTKDSSSSSPYTYHFVNNSTPLTSTDSIYWNFGDGTISKDLNPTHVFAQAGNYNVCLYVNKIASATAAPCKGSNCKTITIPTPCDFKIAYTWKLDSVNHNKVYFINTSSTTTITTSVRWSFGDGTYDSINNTSHTYLQPGKYYVCLRVQTSANCVKYQCDSITIPAPVCNLKASFTYYRDSLAVAINTYHFTNTSSASDSIYWNFGDGVTSRDASPVHVFAAAGNYTVCIYVQKFTTSGTAPCVARICETVIVPAPVCNIQPSFTWKPDSVNNNFVHFINTTTTTNTTTTATWFFGDGTSATTWNATHQYANYGKYYACLRIQTSSNCIKYQCDSITIASPAPDCNHLAAFTFNQSATNQVYTFTPNYIATNIQYTWTFGDGDGTHNLIATHHYTQPGNYAACLTTYRDSNCAATSCHTVNVNPIFNCDSIHLTYNYYKDGAAPNKVYFYTTDNFPVSKQSWTIRSLSNTADSPIVINQTNPYYVFNDTGYYAVCLKALTINGCTKEYCNTIHIETTTAPCELYAYPNPVHTQVSVALQLTSPEMVHAYLYDVQNVLLTQINQQGSTGTNIITMNTQSLAAGFYTIKLIYGNKTCFAKFQKL